jgi:hypothetical protein
LKSWLVARLADIDFFQDTTTHPLSCSSLLAQLTTSQMVAPFCSPCPHGLGEQLYMGAADVARAYAFFVFVDFRAAASNSRRARKELRLRKKYGFIIGNPS